MTDRPSRPSRVAPARALAAIALGSAIPLLVTPTGSARAQVSPPSRGAAGRGAGAGPAREGERDATRMLQDALDRAGEEAVVALKARIYLTGPIRVSRGVRLTGVPGTVLKLKRGVVDGQKGTALVTLETDSALEGLTLDGNAAENRASPAPAFGTALVVLAQGSQSARVLGCTLRDASLFGIFGNAATDATISGNRFSGVPAAGVLLQNASHRPLLTGNRISGCAGSGIKIDAGDGSHPHARLEAPVVRDNWVDYRGVTTRPESLGIEFWTETQGDPGVVGGVISGNTVWGPTGPGAAPIFGISLGGCSDSRCTDNLLYGPSLDIGIETANAIRPLVSGNVIDGAAIGWSASRLCTQPTFLGNKVRNCSRFGAQLIDQTTEALIQGNTWLDAGSDRVLFLNNSGRGSNIQGNTFLLEHAAAGGPPVAAFYVYRDGARGTLFRGNVCRPVPGGSGDSGMVGAYLNAASGVTLEENDIDTTAPSGKTSPGPAVVEAGKGGRNRIQSKGSRNAGRSLPEDE